MGDLQSLLVGNSLPHVAQNVLERLDYKDTLACRLALSSSVFGFCKEETFARKRFLHNLTATKFEDVQGLKEVRTIDVQYKIGHVRSMNQYTFFVQMCGRK